MPEEVERPIKTAKEDRLQRREFVQRLVSALVDTKSRATGMVLGITGPWGSGKSSIINMVAETILKQHTNIVVVQFNPWLINSRDDLITSFFAEVTVALSAAGKNTGATQLKGKLTGLAQTFFDYGKRLAPIGNLMLPGAGSAAAAGLDALSRTVSGGTTLYDLRRRFEHQLEESKTEVMVLIDEIDRLTNAEIAVVAQLVRAIADFPHFSYLLAYDADRVAEALGGGNHERGQAYLEKIVQLSIPLPLILPGQIKLVIQSRFSDLIDFPEDHEQRLKELLDALVPSIVSTFRDAKRLVGVFEVLYRSLCFEVNEVDLLGWAAVLTKYSSFGTGATPPSGADNRSRLETFRGTTFGLDDTRKLYC